MFYSLLAHPWLGIKLQYNKTFSYHDGPGMQVRCSQNKIMIKISTITFFKSHISNIIILSYVAQWSKA